MITLDAKDLFKLRDGFARYQSAIPKSVALGALRNSARPMLDSARRLAPIGEDRTVKKTSVRGGATRRDMRILSVKQEGNEIARIAVGVSGKSGKVGWRTHFITRGFTDRGGSFRRGQDFLQDTYDYTFDIVEDKFYRALFTRFIQWGKENLPQ